MLNYLLQWLLSIRKETVVVYLCYNVHSTLDKTVLH